MTTTSALATKTVGVKALKTSELVANPHNPRVLFDREPMGVLRESIKRMGILVPLTVYYDKAKSRYVILDGQRRWMCAQEVGLKTVPVNQVAPPTLVQNIVTMFQIHKLREDWELMPTALKVELLMEELDDRNDARLSELTGLDESVVTRCKKLLSYDRTFQDRMLEANPDKRMKSDFFIELYPVIHDRDVRKFDWFKEKRFINQMILKYEDTSKPIRAVTDFRLVKQHITSARRAHKMARLSTKLRQFVEDVSVPISHLEIQSASVKAEATALTRKIQNFETVVAHLDVEVFYGEEDMWVAMTKLADALYAKLKQADKRR
jgi:ParB family chromosome partitioning protein